MTSPNPILHTDAARAAVLAAADQLGAARDTEAAWARANGQAYPEVADQLNTCVIALFALAIRRAS